MKKEKKIIKKTQEKGSDNLALLIIVSVILVIMIVALVNVGITIIKESPKYEDYCKMDKPYLEISTSSECEALDGVWVPYTEPVEVDEKGVTREGYCDLYTECNKEYENANKDYNQIRFYFVAVIGFILLLFGLYTSSKMLQYSSLGSGGILFLEGVIMNFENKIVVFISLLIIIAIFGFFAKRLLEK